ncbi:MAG: 3-oxoacid CoA-transferase subunit B [Ignavibacteria bacterium]|nr:3-oxoacid CoA-transferase subunit B [Ignavibacteria bacterium]
MVSEEKNVGWTLNQVAEQVAMDVFDGAYVNLGIGLPELVADYVASDKEVIYHTENGLLGMGKAPEPGKEDPELINAGKKYVTAIKGACYFHHADSFAMIRGGHIDICVMGALQVSEEGDLANWTTGEKDTIPAVGGAMDLVAGVKTLFIIMQHTTKDGKPKIVNKCTYPLTGKNCVNRIYTNLAVIDVLDKKLWVRKLAPNVSFEYLQSKTEAKLNIK